MQETSTEKRIETFPESSEIDSLISSITSLIKKKSYPPPNTT